MKKIEKLSVFECNLISGGEGECMCSYDFFEAQLGDIFYRGKKRVSNKEECANWCCAFQTAANNELAAVSSPRRPSFIAAYLDDVTAVYVYSECIALVGRG